MSRRWRYPRSRRGDFYSIIPAVPATAPSRIPGFQEPAGRNSRAARTRRGRFLTVPLVGLAPAAPSWVPLVRCSRRAPVRPVRRGEFFTVPPVGAAPPPPPSWVPTVTRARRPSIGPVRRGEYQPTPATRGCPGRIVSRRPSPLPRRRVRTWTPPWAGPPAGPGPLVSRTVSRRAPVRPTRRGCLWEPPWVGLAVAARDLTLVGLLEPDRLDAAVDPGRWTVELEADRLTAVIDPSRWRVEIEPNRWEGTVPWPES